MLDRPTNLLNSQGMDHPKIQDRLDLFLSYHTVTSTQDNNETSELLSPEVFLQVK